MNSLFSNMKSPIFLLCLFFTASAATVTVQELDSALFALRSRGYNLFANAITTSDLRLLLLTVNSTFTLFSPPDPFVYSLDLSSTASLYVHSLLRHISPVRLSMSDLRSFRGIPYIDTLVPPHRMSIVRSLVFDNDTVSETVSVDGVRIADPDIFLGSSVAVHGLDGILFAGVEPDSQEVQIDHIAGSPILSPASWSELESPANSPSMVSWIEKNSPASSPTPVAWFGKESPVSSPTPVSWFEKDSPASTPTPVSRFEKDSQASSPAPVSRFEKDSPASSPTPVSWYEKDSPASSPTPVSWYEKDSPASSPTPVSWYEKDSPAGSPTPVSWFEQEFPSSSPTPKTALSSRKNQWNLRGFNGDINRENSKFAKYSREFV